MPDPAHTRTKWIVMQATPFWNESKYALPSVHNLSLLERIARLREWRKWELMGDDTGDGDEDESFADWNKQ